MGGSKYLESLGLSCISIIFYITIYSASFILVPKQFDSMELEAKLRELWDQLNEMEFIFQFQQEEEKQVYSDMRDFFK